MRITFISRRQLLNLVNPTRTGLFILTAFGVLVSCKDKSAISVTEIKQNSNSSVRYESGSFLDEVKRLKNLVLPKYSNLYQPPTQKELEEFEKLAQAFVSKNLEVSFPLVDKLDYEVIEFFDTSSQQTFYGLRENSQRQGLRGWGFYFINFSPQANALIEVPHPLFDRFSPEIAAQVFLKSAARGFLMAGAHRHTNGKGTADVCDPIQSIFQRVHQGWILSDTTTWQIHGFQTSGKADFPPKTQVVLSGGEGGISPEVLKLEQSLEESKFNTYVYNEFLASDPINRQINETVAGEVFSPLAGIENAQGQYCRRAGVPFIHIELDKNIRNSKLSREKVAGAIAPAIQAV